MKTGDLFAITLAFFFAVFGGFLWGGVFGIDNMRTEAVDNNAAYWCVVDHKKVFSWEECE